MPIYKDENKKSGKGQWFVSARYQDWQGQNRIKKKRGFETKREAQQWEREFMLQTKNSIDMSLESFYKMYESDRRPQVKRSTWKTTEATFESKVLPYLGKKKMSEITARDIVQWQNRIRKMRNSKGEPFTQSYLKTIHNKLSALFNHAVQFYNLPSNPVRKAGSMGSEKGIKRDFWTEEEYRIFAEEMMYDPIHYYAFEVLYWTGAREGEMLALTPADFDFERGFMTINKTFQRVDGEDMVTSPKTEKSNRVVKIPEFLIEEMKDCLKMFRDIQPNDRIFEGVTKSSLSKVKMRACSKAGIKLITVHDIRHSHASMLSNLGFPDNAIAERLGHETIRMTQHYSHPYPKKQDEIVEKLDAIRREKEDVRENI